MLKSANKINESVGLDLGSYSMKVVSFSGDSGKNVLSAYNIKRMPLSGENINRLGLIKELFDEIDLDPKYVNLSVSGPDVIVRFVDLPKMNTEQLGSALSFEAEKYIPFGINDVVLDFLILGDSSEPGQMRVLLAAAKKAVVEDLVKIMQDLSVTIKVIDINSFAMFNAFLAATPPDRENNGKSTALIDLGHSQTNIIISLGGKPLFTRQIQIGGEDITDALCRSLSITPDKAEEYKTGSCEDNMESAEQIINGTLDDLVKEIQLSFGYFENRNSKTISDVYCSGGLAFQERIVSYLSHGLGFTMNRWDPVANMEIADDLSREDIGKISLQLAVGIGLALRK